MTLIEIVVVITILALLMTAVAVNVMRVSSDAKRDVAAQDIRIALTALEMFKARTQRYPANLQQLVDAQLIKRLPKDPWRTPLIYSLDNAHPLLVSLGADFQPGGTGDAADISSASLDE